RLMTFMMTSCAALLGASAAAPLHMRKEQGQPARFVLSSWVTRGLSSVPALVPRARLLGWPREAATTSLVPRPLLSPFRRLHVLPSLPPPRLTFVCCLLPEAAMTPHKDYCLEPRPPALTPMLPQSPALSEALQVCHPHAAGVNIGEAEH